MSDWTIPAELVQQIGNAFYVEFRRSCEATLRSAGVPDDYIDLHLAAIDAAYQQAVAAS